MNNFYRIQLAVLSIIIFNFTNLSATTHPSNKLWNATFYDILKHDLLTHYDKVVRPTADVPTNVTVALTITHIDIQEQNGYLNVWGYMSFMWNDNKLKWNPSNYGNLSSFAATRHEVWTPDIVLYNSATIDGVDSYGNNLLLIYNNGDILWVPQIKFDSFCSLNLRMWPFDTQKCSLIFGSWVYSGIEVDANLKQTRDIPGTELDMYVENHEWTIKNVSTSVQIKFYPCCKEHYVSVIYNITLERRSPMYSSVIITPATSLTLMILSVFWLPPQANEKIILNGFNFLILVMFLIYFAMKLPIFAFSTPLIVIFYSSSLLLVAFSFIISVIVLCLSKTKHERKIPVFIGNLLRSHIGKFLGVSVVERSNDQTEMHENLAETNKTFDENFLMTSHNIQYDWILLATAIDRIAFLCYCLIFLILAGSCCLL